VIWNQGQLPENWTVAQLVQAHPSVPYNPAIANVLFRAGLIEAWGSGILRMISDCEKEHTPIPIFKFDFSGFIIEFGAKQEEVSEKMSEKMSGDIINSMRNNPHVTISELAKTLDVSTRTIERHIKYLKLNNKVTREGGDKLGLWQVAI
jgi:ATP-dependent DNA helicase RecG